MHLVAVGEHREVRPGPPDDRFAQRHRLPPVGDVALDEPVALLVFEEDDGVGVAIAARSMPAASAGVEGITTLRPGTCA